MTRAPPHRPLPLVVPALPTTLVQTPDALSLILPNGNQKVTSSQLYVKQPGKRESLTETGILDFSS